MDYAALNAALSDAESDDGGAFTRLAPEAAAALRRRRGGKARGNNGDGDSEGDFMLEGCAYAGINSALSISC